MSKRYWSHKVTKTSNALDLPKGIFTWDDPRLIAHGLIKAARESTRRKTTPYRSAMSMLNFYINRAGRNLSSRRRQILVEAKRELSRQAQPKSRQGAPRRRRSKK